ncbi:M20 family metallopeptidase [Nocardioidaceae bacterium SCSIO 66511]|nr:M20 family metallopeptidase [Nocardioidaceae bacterium SCSIO 66511]
MSANLWASLDSGASKARALRRLLHAVPDLSGHEARTRDAVVSHLPEPTAVVPVADHGMILRFGPPGPAVGVRAELDALPVQEQTDVAWASTSGNMHACGHDVHLAAAAALCHAVHTLELPVPLVLALQPREETMPSGALDIIESGQLDRQQVVTMIGAHVQPLLERGQVACSGGSVNASSDEFQVVISGEGGHGAYPHLGADPVLALSHFVTMVQQVVSRESDPMAPAVVSVGEVHAGSSANVRPDEARASGIVRAMSADHRTLVLRRIREIAAAVAIAGGCTAQVEITGGEPVLVNDHELAARTREHLDRSGIDTSIEIRSCGADDFAFYSAHVPSLMAFVGVGAAAGQLHSPGFLPDEEVVDLTTTTLAAGYLASAGRYGLQAIG